MRFAIIACVALSLVATSASAGQKVAFDTSLGEFVIELDEQKAPITSKNFLEYVDAGFYNGVIFHRVIAGFVIQAGGFTKDFKRKSTRAPIRNEATNGLKNAKYTLSMARTSDPNSATSQFFVNLVNNRSLDNRGPTSMGYAVFAKVVSGTEVVDKIGAVTTCKRGGCQPPVPRGMSDVPNTPVVINKAYRK